MRINKNIIITVAITLVGGVGISALVFKPMGTVATEKNNAELYAEMKENAKEEVKEELQSEFDEKLVNEVAKIKEETNLQIEKLKTEYDKAIADAKLEQANNLQNAIIQAQADAQAKIESATSPEEIERRRQEEMRKNPEKYGLDPIPEAVKPTPPPKENE